MALTVFDEDYLFAGHELLSRAAEVYPDSARLNLHAGILAKTNNAVFLQKVERLDPQNALPSYLLAGLTLAKGSPEKAVMELAQANHKPLLDMYLLPRYPGVGDAIEVFGNSHVSMATYKLLRELARGISSYAAEINANGDRNHALGMMEEVRKMAWTLMRRDDAKVMDVMIGCAIIGICQKAETDIYTEAKSESGLRRLKRERDQLDYLQAGTRAYAVLSQEELKNRMENFAAYGTSFLAIFAQAVASGLMLLLLGIVGLVSRKRPASEPRLNLHAGFTLPRLPALYVLVFAPFAAAAVFLIRLESPFMPLGLLLAMILPPVALTWIAWRMYKRAYHRAGHAPFWRRAPIQEKREVLRVLAGVNGGAMIFLTLWMLGVCGWMKGNMDAFPWQIDRATAGMHQFEIGYTSDLLAGKIEVPEEYLDQVRSRREKQQTSEEE